MNSKHLQEALIESTYISLELKELTTYLNLRVFTTENELNNQDTSFSVVTETNANSVWMLCLNLRPDAE